MPDSGHVVDLATAEVGAVLEVVVDGVRFTGLVVLDLGGKRIRLNRKTPAHLAGFMVQSRPRVWKRLRHVGFSCISIPDYKRRRGDQDSGGSHPAQVRTGVG